MKIYDDLVYRKCLSCRGIYKTRPLMTATNTHLNISTALCPNCNSADSEIVICEACGKPKKGWVTSKIRKTYDVRLICFACQVELVSKLLQ